MPNITILNISSKKNTIFFILKMLFIAVLIIGFIILFLGFISSWAMWIFNKCGIVIKGIDTNIYKGMISYTLVLKGDIKKNQNEINVLGISYKKILAMQCPLFTENDYQEEKKEDEKPKTETNVQNDNSQKIYSKVSTIRYGDIVVRNHTNLKLDLSKIEKQMPKLNLKPKEISVLIVHTHTTESYMPKNTQASSRTTDSNYNVVKMGEILAKELEKSNIGVFHDKRIHDYPEYIGAYVRCLETVQKNKKKFPKIKIVLDIHRDAYAPEDGMFRTVTMINQEQVAKIMFVVGTNQMGLKHANWKQNLAFALKLQKTANKLYSGFCREIDLRVERFNQHVAPGALIIEVGGNGNTITEASHSMKYLAKVISLVVGPSNSIKKGNEKN